jgi:hypothetical protein
MSDEVDGFYQTIIDGLNGEGLHFWNSWQHDRIHAGVESKLLSNFDSEKDEVIKHTLHQKTPEATECANLYRKVRLLSNLAREILLYPPQFDKQVDARTSSKSGVIELAKNGERHVCLSRQMDQASKSFEPIYERAFSWAGQHLKTAVEGVYESHAEYHEMKISESQNTMATWTAILQENIANIEANLIKHEGFIQTIRDELKETGPLDAYQMRVLLVTDYLDSTIYPELRSLCDQLSSKAQAMRDEPLHEAEAHAPVKAPRARWTPQIVLNTSGFEAWEPPSDGEIDIPPPPIPFEEFADKQKAQSGAEMRELPALSADIETLFPDLDDEAGIHGERSFILSTATPGREVSGSVLIDFKAARAALDEKRRI